MNSKNKDLHISQNGIDLIKSFEGCSLKAYKCPSGVWTVGYGLTGDEYPGGVREGLKITQSEAEKYLKKSLIKYENAVKEYVDIELNQNEFDALVSFTYNCGCGALKTSALLKFLNDNERQYAAKQFDLWIRGGGKILPGLVRRRKAEKELFLTPVVQKKDDELFEAVQKIIKSGITLDFNAWKRVDLIDLKNVPALISRLGGLDYLIKKKVISDRDLWTNGSPTKDNVRSLLVKFSKIL